MDKIKFWIDLIENPITTNSSFSKIFFPLDFINISYIWIIFQQQNYTQNFISIIFGKFRKIFIDSGINFKLSIFF
ncbi:hypothetical protein A3A03_02850 [Candidatus Nomurabacteria bacterium RIFCSPLOWO2_01_FULL_40_18]|uniref:Uncharacterized protein n=1 Tax=Candidatus Nomurabacteria bacterium RIFCSPLOWO2_01_FULL_40_18 TaxID=1801773 RepID=A0A1F6XJX7_9BACT|nr:MAG: hypothetical protein A3A03_02850 [Candidatus Nomurabacteria bacterium RIFCSPLOWO2_01_FULL_40_18]